MTIAPGELIQNRYRIDRMLGSGGFASVYLAEDLRLRRMVAIKEMDAARLASDERTAAADLFEREAHMLAGLDHPGLTRIWDYFQHAGRAFLVMEYAPGQTLQDIAYQASGPLPETFVLECALQLCDVLAYLHSRHPPVIFRDLKPANVIVSSPAGADANDIPQLKLIDFGIARLFKPDQSGDTMIIGTPGYAPPEQYGHGQTDQRSDIYSLGATLHHLLNGQPPAGMPLPSLAGLAPHVSTRFVQIITRATALDPAQRYQDIESMRRDLRAVNVASSTQDSPHQTIPLTPLRSRLRSLALISALAVAMLVVIGLAMRRTDPPDPGQPTITRPTTVPSARPTAVPSPRPTVAPAAQEWSLSSAPGQIAYGQRADSGGYNVFVATLAGQSPRQITSDQQSYSPAWSPDGRNLAITRGNSSDRGIFISDANGQNLVRVTPPDQEARYPAWSPDGRRIAYAARIPGQPWQLAIIDLESGVIAFPGIQHIGWVSWAPGELLCSALAGAAQDIFLVSTDGNVRNLTNSAEIEEDFPAWSPDARKIAYTTSPAGQLDLRQIAVMQANGSDRAQLSGTGPSTNPVWSPDGRWIAYLSRVGGGDWQVWAMRADGNQPRQITTSAQQKFYLSWGD